MRLLLSLCLPVCLASMPAAADEVSDTLTSALEAYQDGDVAYAMEELVYAQQLLQEMKAGELEGFVPEALDGWTRTLSEDAGAAMGMLGGGTAAEAEFSNGSDSFTLTIMADSPMVAMMSGMFGNAQMMAAMGKIERIGRQKFLNQDGDLSILIGNRIIVQASGGDLEAMKAHLEQIDYRALENFGQ